MKKVTLTKINTREDAEYPQIEKYPDNYSINGYMIEKPQIGKRFYLYESKLYPKFVTSEVKEVNKSGKLIHFKTLNSNYKIEI